MQGRLGEKMLPVGRCLGWCEDAFHIYSSRGLTVELSGVAALCHVRLERLVRLFLV